MKIKPEVAATFDSYPIEFKRKLLELRQLILETAAKIESVGEIEETLKWGEPSYLTPKSKSGSTIRIAWKETKKNQYSIFFKCTANLVPAMKERFPDRFTFGGKRSIDFKLNEKVPKKN
jgi:transposase